MENEMKDKKETLRNLGLEKLFDELEEQGWHPMLCDTPVPVYDNAVPCGKPADVGDVEKEYKLMPEETVSLQPGFMVKAKGDSMKDVDISEGDMVNVLQGRQAQDGDIVLARIDNDYTLKAYLKDSDGQVWLVPQNPDYEAFPLPAGAEVVGVASQLIKAWPRATYRSCLGKVQKAKLKKRPQKELKPELVAEAIRTVAPMVTVARQWFAVYRVLADKDVVGDADFATFCMMVQDAVPEHGRLPNLVEMQRLNIMSFAKQLKLWKPDNSPVTGKRYLDYLMIAQKMAKLLEEGSLKTHPQKPTPSLPKGGCFE